MHSDSAVYSEPTQISNMVLLEKYSKSLSILAKNSILDVWQGSEYAFEITLMFGS